MYKLWCLGITRGTQAASKPAPRVETAGPPGNAWDSATASKAARLAVPKLARS